jgi:NADH:ubiquinone oxidoreductase subunit 2 (subunit N)
VMVAASIAGYFYIRLVLSLYDTHDSSEVVTVPRTSAFVIAVGVLSALVFGLWPGPLESLAQHAVLLLP